MTEVMGQHLKETSIVVVDVQSTVTCPCSVDSNVIILRRLGVTSLHQSVSACVSPRRRFIKKQARFKKQALFLSPNLWYCIPYSNCLYNISFTLYDGHRLRLSLAIEKYVMENRRYNLILYMQLGVFKNGSF